MFSGTTLDDLLSLINSTHTLNIFQEVVEITNTDRRAWSRGTKVETTIYGTPTDSYLLEGLLDVRVKTIFPKGDELYIYLETQTIDNREEDYDEGPF